MTDPLSDSSSCSSSCASEYDESEGDIEMASQIEAYQNEPLASSSDEESDGDEEVDIDGLTPTLLARRFEVLVHEWCQCGGKCKDENLVGALEFRCCHEVKHAIGMLVFDGSIERINCITEHEDFPAITNKIVLLQVAPLLRNKCGKTYRNLNGVSQNEFIRSVAYRWIARWLCGYMGWDNCRPLPACVYHYLRHKFKSNNSTGYITTQDRE